MRLPVRLRRIAQAEYDRAVDWYEQQRPGYGARFGQRVQEQLDRIAAAPLMHAMIHGDIRRTLVPGFPYSVFYRVLPAKIVVVSVFHNHRDPRIWQSRS
jgi:plasmid stabilization system protein ParE